MIKTNRYTNPKEKFGDRSNKKTNSSRVYSKGEKQADRHRKLEICSKNNRRKRIIGSRKKITAEQL